MAENDKRENEQFKERVDQLERAEENCKRENEQLKEKVGQLQDQNNNLENDMKLIMAHLKMPRASSRMNAPPSSKEHE
jgi:phage shock protein A